MTTEEQFLEAATRAANLFGRDILDGGVSAPIGRDGVFFEEVAVYPAGHILNGHLFGLFGLYDYLALTKEPRIAALVNRSLATLRGLIGAYDTGYWSRYDLLHGHLAPPFYHELHVAQLAALGQYSGDAYWAFVAKHWERYQSKLLGRARQLLARQIARSGRILGRTLRPLIFQPVQAAKTTRSQRVVVPVTAYPILGGIRAVLAGVSETMADDWRMEYLTREVSPAGYALTIQQFGGRVASPWHFPSVWLYVLTGGSKLFSLLRRGDRCRLILPQDSVFTGAFSAVVGKLAGARVVCIEHGTVTFPFSPVYHRERLNELKGRRRSVQVLGRLQMPIYWRSIRLLASLTARLADHFLVAGEESATVYLQELGVDPYRLTRWRFTIDVNRYAPPSEDTRALLRANEGLYSDAIVVAIVARLSPAKGLDTAIHGIQMALSRMPVALRDRVRVIIAGEGPLRGQVEDDLRSHGLNEQCALWGDTSSDRVTQLLGLCDIFLYTSTRGTNFSMAVLEAMAAGCAVIASTEPISNRELLSEGRGFPIPAGDAKAVSEALIQAVGDLPRCREMGRAARSYIAEHHSSAELRRALLRATFWSSDLTNLPTNAGQREAVC